jgi:hypothetical protein
MCFGSGSHARSSPTTRACGAVGERCAVPRTRAPSSGRGARQVLALGRLDELIVQVVPVVLGDGVRLFGEAPLSSRAGAHVRRYERDAHRHTLSGGRTSEMLNPARRFVPSAATGRRSQRSSVRASSASISRVWRSDTP